MSIDLSTGFDGMTIIHLPDDDTRFGNVPAQCVVADGNKLFVRESEWPALMEMLRHLERKSEGA